MASPSTVDELLDLARKSGVLEEKKLASYLDKRRAAGTLPAEPPALAQALVQDGLLTRFQADQLMQGKWRRFFIGKYKVLERLGAGGMGSVYLCEHRVMRNRVAVKVLPTSRAEDRSSRERFFREARALARLDHPNIVRAIDIDEDDKLHFLVMEYIDGSNLQEIVKRFGPLDISRACHYISQSAMGLDHAYTSAGLVHRDIKPGNILIDRSGVVKLLDMGLARFFHDEEDRLTKELGENVLGTADYLAPEQARDSRVDIRADIYSLGNTFYYCLTGRAPFAEGKVTQKLIWQQTRQPKPIRSIRPEVPEELVAIIDKMIAKDPEERYQMPIEVVQALEPWTATSIAPPPEEEMPRLCLAAQGPEPSKSASVAPLSAGPKSPRSAVSPRATPRPPSAPRPARPTPADSGPIPGSATPAGAKPAKAGTNPVAKPARQGPKVTPAAGKPTAKPARAGGTSPRQSGPQPVVKGKAAPAADPAEEVSLDATAKAETDDRGEMAQTEPAARRAPAAAPAAVRQLRPAPVAVPQPRDWRMLGLLIGGGLVVIGAVIAWLLLS
jgi:serine/threonine protein kinase